MTESEQPSSGSRWEPAPGSSPAEPPAWAAPAAAGGAWAPGPAAAPDGGPQDRRGRRRVLTGAGLVLAGGVVGGVIGFGTGHALAGDGGSGAQSGGGQQNTGGDS